MVIAALKKPENALNRISIVLKEAGRRGDMAVTIIISPQFYKDVFNILCKAPHVDQMIISGVTHFLIKDFRVELKEIDMYV
jgi:hypothetical protein